MSIFLAALLATQLAAGVVAERPKGFVTPPAASVADVRRSQAASDRLVAFWRTGKKQAEKVGFSGAIGLGYHHQGAATGPTTIVIPVGKTGEAAGTNAVWRWASVTKQVIAVLVMQEVAAGRIALDSPVGAYLPRFASPNAGQVTVRQLLRHQSGLPDPNATAEGPDGIAAFYRSGAKGTPLDFCAGPVTGPAGGRWTYNNCDYVVAGALLEAVIGKNWQDLVRDRISKPLGLTSLASYPTRTAVVVGREGGKPEAPQDLARYGAAGALVGSPTDLLRFDIALMSGRLIPDRERSQMWDGKPELGSIALGQWVFDAPLRGCAKPVRIVERRGAIGGIGVRNLMLPESGIAIVLFSDEATFDFGEIWQAKGFSYDMLSLAACAQRPE